MMTNDNEQRYTLVVQTEDFEVLRNWIEQQEYRQAVSMTKHKNYYEALIYYNYRICLQNNKTHGLLELYTIPHVITQHDDFETPLINLQKAAGVSRKHFKSTHSKASNLKEALEGCLRKKLSKQYKLIPSQTTLNSRLYRTAINYLLKTYLASGSEHCKDKMNFVSDKLSKHSVMIASNHRRFESLRRLHFHAYCKVVRESVLIK